jgi:Niemann-Pick C1 protein
MPVQCSSTVKDGVMRPTTEEFEQYLPAFLVSNPVPKCAKGGHAAYAQVIEKVNYSVVTIYPTYQRSEVSASKQHCPTVT